MKQTIRFFFMLMALMMGATNELWAQEPELTESDIVIDDGIEHGTVAFESVTNRKVTLTVTPGAGYYIKASDIVVEKLVDPGNANAPERRTPAIADVIPGTMYSGSGRTDDDIISSVANSNSAEYDFTVPADYNGVYVTATFKSLTEGDIIRITASSDLGTTPSMTANYVLVEDVSATVVNALYSAGIFTGTFEGEAQADGSFPTISGLTHALFQTINGGTVKNIMFDNVNISGGTNVGTVCNEAIGDTRIYNCGVLATGSTAKTDEDGYTYLTNCSSTVSGSNYVGSIVGLLDATSRVINCFSYANVSGGTVGGIVGYNNVATTATNLKTMVMNCMFYGEVSGSSIAPIYNGEIITNDGDANGVNNFNYFRLESSYIENTTLTKVYNCALGAETRFLQRFEFFRHLLNSNRELAAWWATGSPDNKDEMMKWVLEPSQIGSSTPYPVLKDPDYYPSVVNIDAKNAPTTTERNKGGRMGTLSVTIQPGNGKVYNAPTGAHIRIPFKTLTITDKDPEHFNFNYYKVQLPYYNEVGTGNYTENRVVTGWKIVSVTTDGSVTSYNDFTTGDDAPAYNFADRKCTAKDIYSETNKRVFNQGAYWDVPEGVTGITIQPYWGNAVYLSDAYWDVTYKNSGTDAMVTPVNVDNVGGGQHYGNGETFNSQTVYTNIGDAIASTALYAGTNEATYSARSVYDYAVVLVGNYHHYGTIAGGGKPYTLTSVDLNGDNEPDYSLMLRFNGRTVFHPVRYDFLNILGLGMAQKTTGGTGSYNLGIIQPKYWFESTNTSLFHVTQFEYDRSDRGAVPYIVQGGVMEQWVSGQNNGAANKTIYFHVGGNVWFKEFHRGTHQDKTMQSKHPPVSVTGGDYDEFYLTGLYTANVKSFEDNAECYINGGRFGTVAGAAMEGIGKANGADDTGNITWQVQNADIKEFFAGGINAAKPVTGNLSTTITGGKIDLFCGGPKFGDMSTGKTVTTNATDCIFGTFFGAGYGGNSYSRQAPRNHNNLINFPHNDGQAGNHNSWNDWLDDYYTQSYSATYGGVSTQFSYQFLPMSGNVDNCARIFVEYVKFSLATCRNVTSTLTGCQITGNFYGGGSLGVVDGPVTSTLTNCEVQGNVFGAGFSASLPSVEVDAIGFETEPYYYKDLGTYRKGVKGSTTTYKWQHGSAISIDTDKKILYTTEELDELGAVTGNATLTINGTTTVGESVYGGGQESNVEGKTQVNITGGTITQNVFGGGMGVADNFACSKAMVGVNDAGKCADPGSAENKDKGTKVSISNGTVNGNVYGGGEVGRVEWNTQVEIGVGTGDGPFAPEINGSVYGAGKGKETHGYAALVRGNSSVTIQGKAKVRDNVYGGGEQATVGRYWVKGIDTDLCSDEGTVKPTAPDGLPDEMPYKTRRGGKCTVIVQGEAQIGPNDGPTEIAGHVFGAGKGVTPDYNNTPGDDDRSKRMVDYKSTKHTDGEKGDTWDYYPDDHKYVWEYFATEDKYFEFLQTLALATGTDVTINGSAKVKGSVYGGSESGYVQDDTDVKVKGGTIGTKDYGGAYYGNVYGGGKGDAKHMGAEKKYVAAGLVKGNTKVKIENGTILHNIYGGGAYGSVGEFTYDANGMPTGRKTYTVGETVESTTGGNTEIMITGGTIGSDGHENGMVFGSSRGYVAAPGTDGVDPNDRMAWVYSTHVKIGDTNVQSSPTIKGSIYGSGENGHTFQNTIVDVNKGIIGITDTSVDGGATYAYRGNVYGGGCGTDKYDSDNDGTKDKYNPLAGIVQGTTTVNITGGHVVHNVYGAGAMGSVGGGTTTDAGKTTINVTGGRIGYDGNENGHVFGAARGEFGVSDAASNLANVRETEVNINYATTPAADNEGKTEQLIAGSVFGGGEAGTVKGSVAVKMTGGLVLNDVYGGGALADTQTSNWDADANSKAGGWATGMTSASSTTTVRLTGGTIMGEAYGGGLGETGKPAYVYGDVLLDLNGETKSGEEDMTIAGDARGCAVDQVFGCNNAAGTPMGDVLVHVHATQNKNKSQVANSAATVDTPAVTDAKQKGVYDVSAVYGGGNLAAYEPADPDNNKTEVVIDGCELTSIKQVYGGGNAACAPSTNVTVNGTFEVEELFGGGNGLDNIVINGVTKPNPGANVGYKNYSEYYYEDNTWKVRDMAAYDTKDKRMAATDLVYGTGKASVNIYGGTVHRVFGGSNTKGNVRQTALTLLDDNEGCTFCVDEAYGGGKSAEMDAEAKLLMACIPGLEAVYGGAEAADVRGNVTLNITNGTFDRVFGGNNLRGTISGSITVNVEEIGCKPVKIGELYGGGNQAGYSVYGYDSDGKPVETVKPGTSPLYDDPQVNVMSFTSIGNVYGGGYGEGATMVGNPTVNINEAYGKYYNEDVSVVGENAKTPNNYPIPSHAKGKMGAISNVFGGGNAAKVIGNTTVNIATLSDVYIVKEVTTGATLPAGCYTRNNNGTYSEATGIAVEGTTYYEKKDVLGVDIRGNVYGGGNNAEVTGSTNVTIGKEEVVTPAPQPNPAPQP